MPIGYYLIPMVDPPYSRENKQRPQYVDEIRCNWSGHNVDELGCYICLVNTTPAKHGDLSSRAGVIRLGDRWEEPSNSNSRAALQKWMGKKKMAYDANETVGDLANRIIKNGHAALRGKSGQVWPGGDKSRVYVEEY